MNRNCSQCSHRKLNSRARSAANAVESGISQARQAGFVGQRAVPLTAEFHHRQEAAAAVVIFEVNRFVSSESEDDSGLDSEPAGSFGRLDSRPVRRADVRHPTDQPSSKQSDRSIKASPSRSPVISTARRAQTIASSD